MQPYLWFKLVTSFQLLKNNHHMVLWGFGAIVKYKKLGTTAITAVSHLYLIVT